MATQGSFGVKLKIDISSTLTAIAYMTDVSFPAQEKELADITPHPTTGNTGYREWLDTGVRSLSDFTCTLTWDAAESTHAAILSAFDSTSPVSMSIEDPTGGETIAFSAHIKRISRLSALADAYKAEVQIQPTGAPTIA